MPQNQNLFEAPLGKHLVMQKRNLEQEKLIIDEGTKSFIEALNERKRIEEKTIAEIERYKKAGNKERVKDEQYALKHHIAMRVKAEKKLEDAKIAIQEKAQKAAEKFETNRVLKMTSAQRRDYFKDVSDKLKQEKLLVESEYEQLQKKLSALNPKSLTYTKTKSELEKQIIENRSYAQKLDRSGARTQKLADKFSTISYLNNPVAEAKLRRQATRDRSLTAAADHKDKKDAYTNSEAYKKDKELQQELIKARLKGNKEEIADIKEKIKENRKASKEYQDQLKSEKELRKATASEFSAAVSQAVGTLIEDTTKGIDTALDDMFGSQGRMMGRLQGSAVDWAETVDSVSETIGLSGIVSKRSVVKKMEELVDKGVAYNLEMRAFLAETSENIASTFSATNDTLLRMIRLQQSDSTVARLGMEAMLTELLNQMFSDTSYLANSISDSVSAAVLDASALLDKNQSLEFEYTLQKWMGALYSLGMSSEGVSNIARGINYIGTGDVTKLAQDSSLMTVFQFAASRSNGKSLAELFDSEFTGSELNKLLKSLIETLSNIDETSASKLTRTAWADVLGMSVTDLTTFSSLTSSEINKIYNSTANYNTMLQETADQLAEVSSRLNLSKLIDTAIANAEVGVAASIGNSAVGYGTWKALNLLEHYVGEVNIPSILAAGFGLSSDINLINVAKTGVAGMGLIGQLIEGVMSLTKGGVTNLSNWNFSEYTARTNTNSLSILPSGSSKKGGYSTKLGVGSTDSSDLELITTEAAKEKAYESAGVTSEELEEEKDIYKKIYESISNGESVNVLSVLQNIQDLLSHERVFYTAITGVASGGTLQQVNNLSSQVTSSSIIKSSSDNNTSENNLSNAISGTGSTGSSNMTSLESVIAAAVESALRAVAGSSMGSGLPVYVTNINGYEGG